MEATSAPRPHAIRFRRPRRLLAALSDERLVDHVRSGDETAFEVLYDRHSAGILGFCRHMLRAGTDAEDAVQQTFIAAYDDIQRHGDRELHVKAWLYTIARNRCLSMLRARREQPADDHFEVVSDSLDHDLQQREDLRALLADVTKLPADQREALVLAEVGDLSHSDISEVIGCEVPKVKSLVFQARTNLIDRRVARETSCAEIREQIATLRGGALRRSHLRHHIEACPGCARYREEVRRQRAMLAVALPVLPSAALKAKVLGGLGLSGGSTAAGIGAGSGMAVAAQSGLAKLGIAAVIAAGTGGAAVAAHNHVPLLSHGNDAAATSSSTGGGSGSTTGHRGAGAGANAAAAATVANKTASHAAKGDHTRSASGTAHGFTPVQGQSNGAAARQFALTRGKGKHLGISKTHHSHPKAHTHTRHAPVAKGHVKQPTRTHTTPTPQATPKTHTSPRSDSTPEQQSTTPTTTEPTPTTTEPTSTSTTPTETQTTPAPSGGRHGNTLGKTLGGTKNSAPAG